MHPLRILFTCCLVGYKNIRNNIEKIQRSQFRTSYLKIKMFPNWYCKFLNSLIVSFVGRGKKVVKKRTNRGQTNTYRQFFFIKLYTWCTFGNILMFYVHFNNLFTFLVDINLYHSSYQPTDDQMIINWYTDCDWKRYDIIFIRKK